MKFPVLASLVVFVIVLAIAIRRSNQKMEHELDDFFEKEKQANAVRKKPLDDLNYISIPENVLAITAEDEAGKDACELLKTLSAEKIVNLTGITNTDLKLAYGTANITPLSEYDQNFTLLVRTLQKLADSLKKENRWQDVKTVLEFAIAAKTDVSSSYRDLADIYLSEGQPEKVWELIAQAKELSSIMSAPIVRSLEDKLS